MWPMAVQQRAEATRALILESAILTFTRNGYDGTGVAEICRQAGISKGAFYHHFPSKQALFLELLRDWMQTLDNQLVSVQNKNRPVPQTLIAMIEVFRSTLGASRDRIPASAKRSA